MLYVLLVQVVLALTIYQIFYCPTRSGPYSIGQEAYVLLGQVLISIFSRPILSFKVKQSCAPYNGGFIQYYTSGKRWLT